MSWSKATAILCLSGPVWAWDGYVVGAGVEADTADASAVGVSAELGLAADTWLSMALARNDVELLRGISINTLYADIGIDHWFKPLGIRAGLAYWGDEDVLDSTDLSGSLYWRNDKIRVSADYEYRDFSFEIFREDRQSGQDVEFHAQGIGLSLRFELSDVVDLTLSGIDYDYNVDLSRAANLPITDFLSVSRLSLINSLVDSRGRVALGVNVADSRWSLDYATWKGEVDGRKTESVTLRLLTPIRENSDIEFGLGVDHSDDFGSVTLFSIFLYFYG